MRTIIALFAVLATCTLHAQQMRRRAVMSPALAAVCPTVNADFEESGVPCNWLTSLGAPDWDNTSSPLAGSQDLKFPDAANANAYSDFAAADEVFVEFKLKTSAAPSSTSATFYVANAAFSQYLSVQIVFTGQLRIVDHGANLATTTDALSGGTPYWVFLHVTKGSGVNAVYDVEFSTTSTRTGSGNKFATVNTGTITVGMETFYTQRLDAEWGTGVFQIDDVKFSTTGWPP